MARAVWSGTGTSSTTFVANSLRGKVLFTLTVTSIRVRPCSVMSATALKGSVMPSAAGQAGRQAGAGRCAAGGGAAGVGKLQRACGVVWHMPAGRTPACHVSLPRHHSTPTRTHMPATACCHVSCMCELCV